MKKSVKFGVIGLGNRGMSLLKSNIINLEDADITAVCDAFDDRTAAAADFVESKRGKRPYATTDYNDLIKNGGCEAVFISASWEEHVNMSIKAMEAGVAVALEVGGAYCIEDCYRLVEAYEKTKTPFMFMENCCYDKAELLATAMHRAGIFGEVVHCSGAYAHDLRVEVTTGKEKRHYRLRNYIERNCDNYPTHDLGPIAKLLNINRGNRMISLVSVASKSAGLEAYINKKAADGTLVNRDLIGQKFNQGDIVDTIITCENGETIRLKLDTTLPRSYDREFTVRGTNGSFFQSSYSVFIDGDPEDWKYDKYLATVLGNAKKYEQKYLPDIWKNITEEQLKSGHGGMDYFEFRAFLDALENGDEMPIDVYDAAAWMAVTCLSEESIKMGGTKVDFPDFTNGKWKTRPARDVIDLTVND